MGTKETQRQAGWIYNGGAEGEVAGGGGGRGKSQGLDFLPPQEGDWEEVSEGEGGQAKCFFRQLESEEMTRIEGQVWVLRD